MSEELLIGLAECLLSTVFYGSGYVPIRNFEYGDGLYSMQIRSGAILCIGFATYAFLGFQHFYPMAMVGGFIWVLANLIILPCIGELGLGIAVLLYSFTNSLTCWFTGNFGLFGTMARPPRTTWLNYVGLVALLIGGGMVTLIRSSSINAPDADSTDVEVCISIPTNIFRNPKKHPNPQNPTKPNSPKRSAAFPLIVLIFVELCRINPQQPILFSAIGFALFSGFLFGEDVTPVIVVQDNPAMFPGAPPDGLPYIFSYYLGIFLLTTLIFSVYCLVKRNHPFVNAELTFPSLLSGVIWGCGQALFIVSTKHLSMSVSGPIASILPACVASVWSVFYFREIKGRRNLLMLCASILVTSVGAACIAFSK